MIPGYPNLTKALLRGAEGKAWRSGGGLRVVNMSVKDSDADDAKAIEIGYGEHPDLLEALRHADEDVAAGGRDYKEVYGKIYDNYVTGSTKSETAVDQAVKSSYGLKFKARQGTILAIAELGGSQRDARDLIAMARASPDRTVYQARGPYVYAARSDGKFVTSSVVHAHSHLPSVSSFELEKHVALGVGTTLQAALTRLNVHLETDFEWIFP